MPYLIPILPANCDLYLATVFESSVIRSILYVAVFVVCLFLLAGVFKNQSVHGKPGRAVEEFFIYFKYADFISFTEKYPAFIYFEVSPQLMPREQVEVIRQQQQSAFTEVVYKYDLKNIAEIRIEKISRQRLPYESSSDAVATGQMLYKNGARKKFRAVLHQERVYSLSIDDECVLNDRCGL